MKRWWLFGARAHLVVYAPNVSAALERLFEAPAAPATRPVHAELTNAPQRAAEAPR